MTLLQLFLFWGRKKQVGNTGNVTIFPSRFLVQFRSLCNSLQPFFSEAIFRGSFHSSSAHGLSPNITSMGKAVRKRMNECSCSPLSWFYYPTLIHPLCKKEKEIEVAQCGNKEKFLLHTEIFLSTYNFGVLDGSLETWVFMIEDRNYGCRFSTVCVIETKSWTETWLTFFLSLKIEQNWSKNLFHLNLSFAN